MLDEIDKSLVIREALENDRTNLVSWIVNSLMRKQAIVTSNLSTEKICDEIQRCTGPKVSRESIQGNDNSFGSISKATKILLEKGSTITFGYYPQDKTRTPKPIEWLVLDTKPNGDALLISKYALERKKYHEVFEPVTWDSCTLRTWLNNNFYNKAFDANEQTKILTTTVTADRNPEYDTNPGIDKPNKIFLLSINEAEKYFDSDESRICESIEIEGNTHNVWWWLRSPGIYDDFAAYVDLDGSLGLSGYCVDDVDDVHDEYTWVRPALWVNLQS